MYTDSQDDRGKPLTCIDVNANDRILCAGTDQIGKDSFILFFDVRKQSTIGGYWESHSEEITQVCFHHTLPDRLASGSTDGLVNVFDISESNEDNAFQYCMNTESSVFKLNWHRSDGDKDLLSCITFANDLHIYDVDESEQMFHCDRKAISDHLKVKSCHMNNSLYYRLFIPCRFPRSR